MDKLIFWCTLQSLGTVTLVTSWSSLDVLRVASFWICHFPKELWSWDVPACNPLDINILSVLLFNPKVPCLAPWGIVNGIRVVKYLALCLMQTKIHYACSFSWTEFPNNPPLATAWCTMWCPVLVASEIREGSFTIFVWMSPFDRFCCSHEH